MIYGYIRVSTDKQTVENQRFEINHFCERNNLVISSWLSDDGVSGTKDPSKRELGKLLKRAGAGDIIICSELSRLGRNLLMIMSILNYCMENDIKIWTIKDNYRLGDDIQSKVLAFAFGLSAEIERNLISQRTKEALARKKAEGVVLGRPAGVKSRKVKLSGYEKQIYELLKKGVSYSAIGRILNIHRLTVTKFVKERMDKDGNLVNLADMHEVSDIEKLSNYRDEIISQYENQKTFRAYKSAAKYGVSVPSLLAFIKDIQNSTDTSADLRKQRKIAKVNKMIKEIEHESEA